MHVYESNNIRVSGYPLPLKLKIVDDLTIDNPAYLKAKYQRRPTWGIDQKLQLFTYDNDGSLILPRGYADRLYSLISETTTSIKWDKEQVEGEPVDFGPWNENFQIRDYQHPLIDSLLHKNGIGVSPAGSGKTIMGMRYIYEVGRPTLWLTHTRDLVYQTRDRALSTLKGVGRVGILGDGVEDFGDRKLIIATVQTLKAKQRLVRKCIIAIITSAVGIKCQDALMETQIKTYAASIEKKYGSLSDDAMMECINIIHQGGSGALTRILAKTQKPYTAKTIYAALCTDPADKSNNNQVGDYVTRQKVVYGFITKYCNKEGVNTMGYSRQAVADLVNSWVGKNEADGSYKTIIEIYNSYKGTFPRGTKMDYSWPWCACTWSAAAIKLGYTPIMPIEISCYYLIEAAKKKGIWIENDAHVPKVGEGVLYYWKDGMNFATTDCTGVPDHVGTVTEVYEKAGYFVVTEGNYSNAVKKRTLLINGRYIRGFISPKYTDDTVTPVTPAAGKDLTTVAREVILGVWGNMPERKTKLEASGYNFTDVQNKVNELLNKNVPTPSKPQNTGVTKVVAGSGAASFDKSLAGSYVTTTGLYMRHGAGKNKRAMVLIPEGTEVQNYGYYTSYNGTKWLYIQVTLNGVQYTGFSSKTYLKKQ